MLDLFFEKKEFFQMKELEKLGPKEKGVISQSVKDVVTMLVDDGLVDTEKIGTMVCFWAFPSKAMNTRKHRLDDMRAKKLELDSAVSAVEKKISAAAEGKEDTEERRLLLSEMASLESKKTELTAEIDKYKEFDPETIKALQTEAEKAKEAANRWTDNIESIKQWCKKKFGIEEKDLNKQFEIPEDMDYVE